MIFQFLKHFGVVKAEQIRDTAIGALIEADPATATATQMRVIEEDLDKLGQQVVAARREYETEKREADSIQAAFNQALAAAELLEKQSKEATDPARKHELELSLERQLAEVERMAPEVEREAAEARQAEEILSLTQRGYDEKAQELKTAKAALKGAERDLQHARRERELAERHEQAARTVAGLTAPNKTLNLAAQKIAEAAQRERNQTAAARMKTEALKPAAAAQQDKNIVAAMAAVSGTPATPTSTSERLAALRQRAKA